MIRVKTRECVMCGKGFKVKIGGKSVGRRTGIGYRPKTSLTCSPKCSRDYTYLRSKKRNEGIKRGKKWKN